MLRRRGWTRCFSGKNECTSDKPSVPGSQPWELRVERALSKQIRFKPDRYISRNQARSAAYFFRGEWG